MNQKASNDQSKTVPSAMVLDGSSASRAIPPGNSRPGWESGITGHDVIHGDIDDVPGNVQKSR